MAEREVVVCGSDAGRIRLRLLGSACEGCAGGCGGRCSLFATDDAGEITLPASGALPVSVGDTLRLRLDDASLRRAAWRGYGLAWLGLMLGAGLGFGVGQLLGSYVDILTLAGLACGTFAAVMASSATCPNPRCTGPGLTPFLLTRTSDRP